jgi:hypothetical protein
MLYFSLVKAIVEGFATVALARALVSLKLKKKRAKIVPTTSDVEVSRTIEEEAGHGLGYCELTDTRGFTYLFIPVRLICGCC